MDNADILSHLATFAGGDMINLFRCNWAFCNIRAKLTEFVTEEVIVNGVTRVYIRNIKCRDNVDIQLVTHNRIRVVTSSGAVEWERSCGNVDNMVRFTQTIWTNSSSLWADMLMIHELGRALIGRRELDMLLM